MAKTVFQKIIDEHKESAQDDEIAIKIDHTLMQDATGTMTALEFQAMQTPRVKTQVSASFIDHNTLQTGFENADDHRFLQSFAKKHGLHYSQAGGGICHQVFLECLATPGKTLLGSDSHTPTAGGLGVLAIGAGGLDVAAAMAGFPYFIQKNKIVGVKLSGKLENWASAKDVALELLRRLTVKGGVGKVFEYHGEGVQNLSVPQRATIANMGAELGATTSIFPSDERTLEFLTWQEREKDFVELKADENAKYDEVIEINLSEIEPLIALPHSPDNVVTVKETEGTPLDQVLIGSCTNSSLADLETAAEILSQGKTQTSLAISPASASVLNAITQSGALQKIISSGARILECACGPCIGMGQAPVSNGNSLRTFNRNFQGRSGTKNANVFLCSVETAASSALRGKITHPETLFGKRPAKGQLSRISSEKLSQAYSSKKISCDLLQKPLSKQQSQEIKVIHGPNIAPLPQFNQLPKNFYLKILLKLEDNVTTDDVMPAGAKILPLRSNINKISNHVFEQIDPSFSQRALELKKTGVSAAVIGGENYGQGSSREHAALAPAFLGVKIVLAKSFARIHKANLVNFGVTPLEFSNPKDYQELQKGFSLEFNNDAFKALKDGKEEITLFAKEEATSSTKEVKTLCKLNSRQRKIILAGGLLNYAKQRG